MRPTKSDQWKTFFHGICEDEADDLYFAALKVPDNEIIVEIGSYKGSSTYALALGCVGRNVKVYAVDTWMGSPGGNKEWKYGSNYFDEFKQNLHYAIKAGIVVPLEMSSAGALMYTPRLEPYLMFIDGSHQYEDVLFDITYWWKRLKPEGVMAIHDSSGHPKWHPQVRRAVDKFRKDMKIEKWRLKSSTSWLYKEK